VDRTVCSIDVLKHDLSAHGHAPHALENGIPLKIGARQHVGQMHGPSTW